MTKKNSKFISALLLVVFLGSLFLCFLGVTGYASSLPFMPPASVIGEGDTLVESYRGWSIYCHYGEHGHWSPWQYYAVSPDGTMRSPNDGTSWTMAQTKKWIDNQLLATSTPTSAPTDNPYTATPYPSSTPVDQVTPTETMTVSDVVSVVSGVVAAISFVGLIWYRLKK